jgi:hypothetical protein
MRKQARTGLVQVGAMILALAVAPAMAQPGTGRIVEDRSNGVRWLLEPDPTHPGGPGKMTAVGEEMKTAARKTKLVPVIHAGDRVTVVETTSTADVSLVGVAISPAAEGEVLKVRLSAGSGWMVRAVATGAGRARLAGEAER